MSNATKKTKTYNKTFENVKMIFKEPGLALTVIVVFALILLFVIYPLLNVFMYSITDDQGSFNFASVIDIFNKTRYRTTFMNSVKLGIISAIISTIIGYIFAYALTRVDLPGKRFFKFIAMLPIISPPFILSLAVIFLFGRQGLITNGLFGISDFNVYGLHSLILIQTMSYFPTAYLTLSGILESIDPSVEDAAMNLGGSSGYTFRTVTLPLSLPGILSALLLVFIQSLEDFSNPAVIAGNYSTLSVEAYRVITGMYDLKGGSILAIMLLLPTLLAFILNRYWISGKSFVTVSGKPSQKRPKTKEKKIVYPLLIILTLFSAIILLFYGTVLLGAFVKVWGVNFTFTLDHFKYVFSLGWGPMKNSIVLSLISMPIAGILGMIIAYLLERKTFYGKSILEFSSMLTFALPGTIVGIGFILAFNDKPLILTGTALILILVFVFRNMPVGIQSATASLKQIDPSIEEASTNLGASSFQTFRKVTLPLIKPAFFSGLVYSFVKSMTAVSAAVFLVSAKWSLVTTKIYSLFEVSQYSSASAYVVIMIIVILIVIGALNIIVEKIGKTKM